MRSFRPRKELQLLLGEEGKGCRRFCLSWYCLVQGGRKQPGPGEICSGLPDRRGGEERGIRAGSCPVPDSPGRRKEERREKKKRRCGL